MISATKIRIKQSRLYLVSVASIRASESSTKIRIHTYVRTYVVYICAHDGSHTGVC